MDEDEFYNDLPETILIADIEWGSSVENINWEDPNFPNIILERCGKNILKCCHNTMKWK